METFLFYLIVAFLIVDYAVGIILDRLNANSWSQSMPAALSEITDEEKYRRSHAYFKVNYTFGLVGSTLGFVLILVVLFFDGFGLLDGFIRQFTGHPVWMTLLFFGAIGLASELLSIPLSVYQTFVIEEEFGFNRTRPRTFVADKLKGWVLAIVLGGGILAAVVTFYRISGSYFWILAWATLTLFSVLITMFYTHLILPLFNKLTPLKEGDLRTAIEEYARSRGFKLENIYIMDGSRRSAKANAFFSGLGKKKRIVLFDTLVESHAVDELVAILAHELGHYRKKHTLKGLMLSVAQSGIMLFLLGILLKYEGLSSALGAQQPSFHMGVLAFGLLYAPVSMLLGVLGNYLSRKHEYEADAFAATTYAAKPLQTALKKLSVDHLSNLKPHPAYVFVHYSHPPLLQRLSHLDGWRQDDGRKPNP